jgi:hypothetical protein
MYWCSSSKKEAKRIFDLKEMIISNVLSVENISKSYFDLSFIKLFIFKKSELKKLDYLYENILKDRENIYILRNYLYNSNKTIFDKINNFGDKNKILDSFLEK